MGRKPKAKTRRTGQGSVFQRKDGRWGAAVTIGYNENGNAKRVQITEPTREKAVDELNKVLARLSLGVPPKDDGRTVAEYLDYWLEECVMPHREPKTYRSYEQSVRLHLVPHIGHLRMKKLTAAHIQALWNRLSERGGLPAKDDKEQKGTPLSPATVLNAKAALRRALNVAFKQRLITSNPALMTETPKVVHAEPVYLSQEEVAALLRAAAADPLGNLVKLALMTGLRLGEATGLTWDDVDLDAEAVHVRMQLQRVGGELVRKETKSRSSRRTLSLTPSALAALKDQQTRQLEWHAARERRREEKRQAALRKAERLAKRTGTPLPPELRGKGEGMEVGEAAPTLTDSATQRLNDSAEPFNPAAHVPSREGSSVPEGRGGCVTPPPVAQLPDCPVAQPPFNPAGYVFTMPDGNPLDPKTVHDALARMCAAAEITKPISFHKLRHTAATHMAASGVPLSVLKDVLGHSQISLTANTYSHAVPAALRLATDALEKAYKDDARVRRHP